MRSELFKKNPKQYGKYYREHYFEQYKLYLESIEKTSDRRQTANNYFFTINTFLISSIGLTFQIEPFKEIIWLKLLLSFIGIIISVIFYFLVRAYRQLNTGKFEVLHEIESHLPLSIYQYEWKVLGEGKDYKRYYPFSHIEMIFPYVFGLIYLSIVFIVVLIYF